MITLTSEPFEPGALLTDFCAGREETGAVASFVGMARAEKGKAAALELEAYPGFTDAAIATSPKRPRRASICTTIASSTAPAASRRARPSSSSPRPPAIAARRSRPATS
jgi:molybdopterin synthase catalytic subunit